MSVKSVSSLSAFCFSSPKDLALCDQCEPALKSSAFNSISSQAIRYPQRKVIDVDRACRGVHVANEVPTKLHANLGVDQGYEKLRNNNCEAVGRSAQSGCNAGEGGGHVP